MICSNCGKEIDNDSEFCAYCGAKQEEILAQEVVVEKCPNCGSTIDEDSVFCEKCGFQLGESIHKEENQNEEMKSQGNICLKCGSVIPEGSRFCPECGTPKQVDTSKRKVTVSIHKDTNNSEKVKKRNKAIAMVFAIGLALCVVIALFSAIYKPTINLNKYIDVAFDGYDSLGRASVVFNTEKMASKYATSITGLGMSRTSDYLDDSEWEYAKMEAFLNKCVSYNISQEAGLSNGDEIKLKWECNDQLAKASGIKLKYEDVTFKVDGLKEAEYFDPFDGIDVVFSGFSSEGRAEVVGNPTNEAARDFRYELSESYNLSNGDDIILSIYSYESNDLAEYCMENYGVVPTELTRKYTVSGLDSYVETLSDISADALEIMRTQASDVFEADMAKNWIASETLIDFKYKGNYLLKSKKNDSWNNNYLVLVYEVEVNDSVVNEDGDSYNANTTYYWYISYKDLLVNNNGETTVDITNYNTPYARFEVNSGVRDGWSEVRWNYNGYRTLDELYKDAILSSLETYNHEDGIN